MKPVLTVEEYQRVDRSYQGDLYQAMERAGLAVALAAVRHGAGYGSRVVVLCGPGNNGGDGYVAARHLHRRGAHVQIQALGVPRTAEASRGAESAVAQGIRIAGLAPPESHDLVIDALFGGGARGGLPASVVAWMDAGLPVVAVDFPTGLDPSTGEVEDRAFVALETVTFQTLKTGHVLGVGPDRCGKVTVADIGMEGGEPAMGVAEEADAIRPARARNAHKWNAGAVLVVGGSTGMVGASVMAGRSALRFGAGAVVVASPRSDLVTAAAPELLARPIDGIESDLDRFDVVIAGPGLAEPDREAALPILRKATRVVLDAGALDGASIEAARDGGGDVVATPHAGEFQRLAGVAAGVESARSFAAETGSTVLLKGSPTVVTDGAMPILVRTGGPELASIGTGDVLAGMIGALWARGSTAQQAAVSAAYWHGVAGADLAVSSTVTADALAMHVARFAFTDGGRGR
ncbi:MAG TPA: NAD(P)H-hydrate dehydratase [Acidimicrobiia bacterium]